MAVTSGRTWREAREQGIEFTFASGSGNTVAIRPIDVGLFVLTNDIPDVVAGMIAKILNGEGTKLELPSQERIENSKSWIKFLDDLTRFAFVNPKVVSDPQGDDEISIEDVSYIDKLQLFQLFARPAHILRGFRDIQTKSMEAVVPATNNSDQTERPDGDRPVGEPDHRNARHVDLTPVR